jgi:hypothetical protein
MAERLAVSSPDGDGPVLVEVEVGTAVGAYRGADRTRGCGGRGGNTARTTVDVGPGRHATTGVPG